VAQSAISAIPQSGFREKTKHREPVFADQLSAWYSQTIMRPQRFRILNVDRAIAELAADFRAAHRCATK
jgi:hypothetical protein